MSLKSLLQTLFGAFPAQSTPPTQIDVTRLQGRSDWRENDMPFETDGDGVDMNNPPEAPLVAPWDRPGKPHLQHRGPDKWAGETSRPDDIENYITKIAPVPLGCDPWPATDDPYASPEPCTIVPDPALVALDDPRARALTRPMDSVKSVTDLLQLIQRQEAAEKLAIKLGYAWVGTMWARIGDGPDTCG